MVLTALVMMTFAEPAWQVVGSHREALMGFDRSSVSHEGDKASVTVLMGTFKAESAGSPPAFIQYYLSDEIFDCRLQSRTEREVRVYDPNGALLGTSTPDPEKSVRLGSIYHEVIETVCSQNTAEQHEVYSTPLEAIRREGDRRRAENLEVVD